MPPTHRDPYVVRVRRTRQPKPDPDAANSWMAFGDDAQKGVEVRIQTERGALSLKVKRVGGDELVELRAFPHMDFAGRKVGLDSLLWQGSVDGQVTATRPLWPEDKP